MTPFLPILTIIPNYGVFEMERLADADNAPTTTP